VKDFERLVRRLGSARDPDAAAREERLLDACVRRGLIDSAQADAVRDEMRDRELAGRPADAAALLRERGVAPAFLEETVLAETRDSASPRRSIGRYDIVREIARGGMGIVYEAADPALKRRVAIKVLKEGSAALVQRLQREATAAARLRHPNVVAVHEVSSVRGGDGAMSHFIAMDYIDGATLAETRERMPRRERLQTLLVVAKAVAYAHEQGVIHRDLKPQNVLIERGSGQVYISDFGLAKTTDAEDLTRTGTAFGTPLYMAPEQVRGDKTRMGPATDVWALGVMLYDLLADRPPFPGRTEAEVFERIKSDDPPPLGGDLGTICTRALQKDPARRYRSAAEFAEDLRRHLAGEPILARPPSLWERASKSVRRHPAGALVAAVVVAALAALAAQWARGRSREAALHELSALWMQVVLAKRDLHNAGSDPARVRAEIRRAVESVDGYIARHPGHPQGYYVRARGRLALNELASAEDDLRRAVAIEPDFAPGHALLGQVLLDRYAQELCGSEETLPERERRLAPVLEEARGLLAKGSEREWAHPRTREDGEAVVVAEALRRRYLRGEGDSVVRFLEEAHAREPSAAYAVWLGTWTGDRQWFDRALLAMPLNARACFGRAVVREGAGDVDGAIADYTRALEIDPRFREAYSNRGLAWSRRADFEGAIADFTAALRIDPRYVDALLNRGAALCGRGDLRGALADADEALRLSPRSSRARLGRGNVLVRQGDADAAIVEFDTALRLDPRYAEVLVSRGAARHARGEFDAAIADYDEALRHRPRDAAAVTNRGAARYAQGRLDAAVEDYDEALRIDPRHANALANRAAVRFAQGRLDEALADCEEALRAEARCADALVNRGIVRYTQGRFDDAIADFTEALRVDARNVQAWLNRGAARYCKGELDAAVADYGGALAVDPRCADALANRGTARVDRGDHARAVADYEAALRWAGANWPRRADVAQRLAKLRNP